MFARPGHIIDAVRGIGTRPVVAGTHIHGIGAMVDGGNGNVGVPCGSQQLYVNRLVHVAWSACHVDCGSATVSDVQGERVGVTPGREFLPELRQQGRRQVGRDDGTRHALGDNLALEVNH